MGNRVLFPAFFLLSFGCATAEPPCDSNATRCGDICVDLATSPQNCGECDNACGAGEVCHADAESGGVGTCRSECPPALEACAGACVNTSSDPDHCGTCDRSCSGGMVCYGGTCHDVCPAPRVACGGFCVDPRTDPAHCGGCDMPCGAGLLCSEGACGSTCQGELEECVDRCVDLTGDDENCGSCGHACDPGNVCDRGACVRQCPPGQSDCGGRCVDVMRDRTRCGACDNACLDGEYCEAGGCVPTCSEGLVQCDGACVDLDHDPANCGRCGDPCEEGWACLGGRCRDVPLLTFPGVRNNLPIADLGGWERCYLGTYNLSGVALAGIWAACNGPNLMLACRPTGAAVLTVAAHAPRADVLFDTGNGNVPHNANNVGWYYSSSYSFGFARQGDPISRSSCDTSNVNPQDRICWHTSGGNMNGGWRCGATTSLNGSAAWERLIFQH